MKLLIISASHRFPSQSRKVADFVEEMVKSGRAFEEVSLLDLSGGKIPLWDEGVWKGDGRWRRILLPVWQEVEEADAYVIVVPEWNGSVTPAIKNFALFFGEKQTGHKPVWLISVSSGISGSYPITEMRSHVYKNNKWVFIPDHTVVRFVNEVLNDKMPVSEKEALLRERMQYSLEQLKLYAKALRQVRKEIKFDDRFKYAM